MCQSLLQRLEAGGHDKGSVMGRLKKYSSFLGPVNKMWDVWGVVWTLTEVLLLIFQKHKSTVGINTTSCFENVLGNLYMDYSIVGMKHG